MLGVLLHVPRGSLYSPKGPRSRWISIWKALVAFCPQVHRTVRYTPVGVSKPGGPWTDEWIVAACPSPDGSARDGARRGERQPEGDMRERWKSRCLRVCPTPGSGALAVGGYKRPRGRERAASREPLSHPSPRGQPSVRGPWSFLL
jgi:hypothetical protein